MSAGRYQKSAACYEFERQLRDYLDGETRPSVPAHAQGCSFCQPVLADLELIVSASGQLALEEPPEAVWGNLRARLRAEGLVREQTTGLWQRWFERLGVFSNPAPAAVVACLAILATVLTTPRANLNIRNASSETTASLAGSQSLAGPPTDSEESSLASAVGEVETSYKAREKSLEPAVKAVYQKSLDSLNNSIRECRVSILREPSNSLAREYLMMAYAQKAQVLAAALEFDAR